MTTALQIITKAMQKAGILIKSEPPAADEATDALYSLNAMLSSWSTESILIYARTLQNFPLVGGTGSYTIGPGGDFDTVRPIFIVDAHVRQNGNLDYDLTPIPDEIYQGYIALKSQQGIPEYINYTNGYPLATINLYPVPATPYQLFLLTEKPLIEFTLNEDVSLPPGWEQALIYNLAVMLAPEYGQQIDPMTLKIASDSKNAIATSIMRNQTLDAPPMGSASSWDNIYAGWYRY